MFILQSENWNVWSPWFFICASSSSSSLGICSFAISCVSSVAITSSISAAVNPCFVNHEIYLVHKCVLDIHQKNPIGKKSTKAAWIKKKQKQREKGKNHVSSRSYNFRLPFLVWEDIFASVRSILLYTQYCFTFSFLFILYLHWKDPVL